MQITTSTFSTVEDIKQINWDHLTDSETGKVKLGNVPWGDYPQTQQFLKLAEEAGLNFQLGTCKATRYPAIFNKGKKETPLEERYFVASDSTRGFDTLEEAEKYIRDNYVESNRNRKFIISKPVSVVNVKAIEAIVTTKHLDTSEDSNANSSEVSDIGGSAGNNHPDGGAYENGPSPAAATDSNGTGVPVEQAKPVNNGVGGASVAPFGSQW